MNAQGHTEFVNAFYRIAQDRANKIVILVDAGGDFIIDVDWSSFGDVSDPGVWSQVHDEGVQVLENIANIRVPVIAAIEGRAHVQIMCCEVQCRFTEAVRVMDKGLNHATQLKASNISRISPAKKDTKEHKTVSLCTLLDCPSKPNNREENFAPPQL
jgi:hypothetical protein